VILTLQDINPETESEFGDDFSRPVANARLQFGFFDLVAPVR
jgi:hypothetical protein